MENKFQITNLIGKGTFGSVYKAESGLGGTFAVKRILTKGMDSKQLSLLKQEIEVMSNICHRNTVELKFSFETHDCVYMFMEYCKGGDLESLMKKSNDISIIILRRWVKCLLEALEYLHSKDIIHRDLKLANLLLTTKDPATAEIKIGDFGFAKVMTQSITSTQLGSPLYMAPEIFQDSNYTIKADIWSMGSVIYEILLGTPLFKCNTINDLIKQQGKPIVIPSSCKLPLEAIELITCMLNKNYEMRPTCAQLLQHEFLQDTCEIKCREMEEIQDQYIFVTESEEEEAKSETLDKADMEKSELFDESEENLNDIYTTEIEFLIVEELLDFYNAYQIPVNMKQCIAFYLKKAADDLGRDLSNLENTYRRNQIIRDKVVLFTQRFTQTLSKIYKLDEICRETDFACYAQELDVLIGSVSKREAYVLSLVRHYITNHRLD